MARNRTPNPKIGTCPCPTCDLVATVHRYRSTSDNPRRAVNAGKLYLRCPECGTMQPQAYIKAHATFDKSEKPAAKPKAKKPAKPPAEKTEKSKSDNRGGLLW